MRGEQLPADAAPAYRTGAAPARVTGTGGGPAIMSMAEADRRYALPEGHPQKLSHSAYKNVRERFGIRA